VLTLVDTMLARGSHLDYADTLRAGATGSLVSLVSLVLRRAIAPSTLGRFLQWFSFGHGRQLG
jgi:hypothetical protein